MKILTLEEIKKKELSYELFDNGDYSYEDDTGMEYLIRNNKLIATSPRWVKSYSDGWYLYYDKSDDCDHLLDENGKEMIKAEWINRDIKRGKEKEFYIEDIHTYLSKEEIIKYAQERDKISSIKTLIPKKIKDLGYESTEFDNGDYKYKDNKGVEYLIREKKTIAIGKEIESHPNGWYQYRFKRLIDNCEVDRLLNKNHHIIVESETIVVSGDNIYDEEDLEKYLVKNLIEEDRTDQYIREEIKKLVLIEKIEKLLLKEEIKKLLHGLSIPLTMEDFLMMDEERKIAIQDMANYLTNRYNLTAHEEENQEWALAEIMMVSIIPKFLNELTDCGCIVLRTNQFDDIFNKVDIFIVPTKEEPFYCIGIDVTMKEEKNLQNEENKLIRFNIHKPTEIEYGIRFNEKGISREKIPRLTWFYTRIDYNLLKKYMQSVYENNKEKIEKIEKQIFVIFCKDIKKQFQKLEGKRVEICEKYKELTEKNTRLNEEYEIVIGEYKNLKEKKDKRKDNHDLKKKEKEKCDLKNKLKDITEKLNNNRKSAGHLDISLKNAHPFIEYINHALNNILNSKKDKL